MRVKVSSRWRVSVVVLSVAGVLGAPLAQAQSGASAPAADVGVDDLVQRGIELRRTGNDLEALAIFQQAAERVPDSARVRVHLASTHQALGQWLEAEQHLSEVLRETEDPYIRRHRAPLEKAHDFVSRRLGSLDVVGGPVGAEVFLNGRHLGRLPLGAPARVPIGSYVLEVKMDGYYTVNRPVVITSRSLLRESVELGERGDATPSWAMTSEPVPVGHDAGAGSPRWLTWTLAGLGAGAGIVGGVAWGIREQHADRWNSDACLAPGLRRGQVCPDELDDGRSAERLAYAGSITAGLLLGGALVSWLLEAPSPSGEAAGLSGCDVGVGSATCFGSF